MMRIGLLSTSERALREDTSTLYLLTLSATFALLPRMRRFTEYSASWVRIPDRIAGMPKNVWNVPVTRPQSMPTTKAASNAAQTFQPLMIRIAATAPPVAMEPSTVRSDTSRIRYVMYTPIAIRPQIRP